MPPIRASSAGAWLASWALSLATLATLATLGCSDGDGDGTAGRPVKVYTRNLYLGSALESLVAVASPDAVPAEAAKLWAAVQASDFPERAKVLAAGIVAAAPDLVALQEVTLYRTQAPGDYRPDAPAPNATDVELDFLATLMTELSALGGNFHVAVEAGNADAELPVDDGAGGLFDLRVTDRDVILVRDGVTAANPVVTPFQAAFTLSAGGVGGVPIRFARSTSRVDVDVGGAKLTFANAHLEVQLLSADQLSQARETIASLAGVPGPVVLAGDFNSRPGVSSYPMLAAAFHDAGSNLGAGGSDPGFTCCQADDLRNPTSQANERIDLVLFRGAVRVESVQVSGSDPATGRTPGGLWASDHFGVLANLEL